MNYNIFGQKNIAILKRNVQNVSEIIFKIINCFVRQDRKIEFTNLTGVYEK